MELTSLWIGIAAGAALGAGAVAWVTLRRLGVKQAQVAELELTKARMETRLLQMEGLELDLANRCEQIEGLQEEIAQFREERSALEAQLQERNRAIEEQRQMLDEASVQLKEAFASISLEVLQKNNQSFLDLAKEHLTGQQKEAKGELEKSKQAIEDLVKPIKEGLTEVNKHVNELEQKRAAAYASMGEQVKSLIETQATLQKETGKLVQALRSPNQRGKWGEITLRRVVELAGMLDRVDFEEQVSLETEEGRLRPDMVVRLPNGNTIVVDAKAPNIAFLDAMECEDEDKRRSLLSDHARHVRRRVEELSNKNYAREFRQNVEMVVMFMPTEPMLSAAVELDSSLIEFGAEKKVLLATPLTLIPILRAIGFGWRNEALAKDAQKIADAGAELYGRLSKMSEHFARVGKNLDHAVGAYNDMVGSLETRVLPSARAIHELQQTTALTVIEEAKPLERRTRKVAAPEMAVLPFSDEF
ncbi:MAG: DNA recombination protein RmuC [Chthonomonas sp.]|nr:DNA recombination protein RmuC [Chthonomonas sp.]